MNWVSKKRAPMKRDRAFGSASTVGAAPGCPSDSGSCPGRSSRRFCTWSQFSCGKRCRVPPSATDRPPSLAALPRRRGLFLRRSPGARLPMPRGGSSAGRSHRSEASGSGPDTFLSPRRINPVALDSRRVVSARRPNARGLRRAPERNGDGLACRRLRAGGCLEIVEPRALVGDGSAEAQLGQRQPAHLQLCARGRSGRGVLQRRSEPGHWVPERAGRTLQLPSNKRPSARPAQWLTSRPRRREPAARLLPATNGREAISASGPRVPSEPRGAAQTR